MRELKSFALIVFATLVVASVQTAALGQTANDGKLANMSGGGLSIRWDVSVPNAGMTLTISAPDGRIFHKEFRAGASPEFNLTDRQFEKLPDGSYSYELRLAPSMTAGTKDTLKASRANDDDSESERTSRKRSALPTLVQSGSFAILNGAVIVPGAVEGQRATATRETQQPRSAGVLSGNTVDRLRNHRLSLRAMPDQVIPDDLIVQGSACVGLDCVNGEVFDFDTIRMKENNTRLQFSDTSTAAGFPTNNWQLRANSSASGGDSFLGFVDQGANGTSESGTIVLSVLAGAPANSIKVDSTGRVGLRTATPVLDLHINTSNTPAIRLEQNNSGGFTAQTWDIGANEANFFVRDVTSGSTLPLRIRPGAPTSTVDITADGNVGIGTASPVFSANTAKFLGVNAGTGAFSEIGAGGNQSGTTAVLGTLAFFNSNIVGAEKRNAVITGSNAGAVNSGKITFFTANAGSLGERMRIDNTGNIGIGTTAPTQLLSVNGTAGKPGGGTWDVFSDERLKNIKGRYNSGLKALMQLQPLRYEYKPNNALGIASEGEHIGFGAQSLQKIIPEAVTRDSSGYLMIKSDPILWTMLNAIKEQQKEIAELKAEVQKLRASSRKRRK
jgi:hypothetical protein